LGIEALYKIEEEDPQYHAVKRLVESLGSGPALVSVILVALISYRLPVRGEDWWMCLARELSGERVSGLESLLGAIKRFVEKCSRGLLVEQRISRLNRAFRSLQFVLPRLYDNPRILPEIIDEAWKALSRGLSQKASAKTIVFSLKMAYYAYRAAGYNYRLFNSLHIPMPIDSRVACLTFTSSICDASSYRELVRYPENPQRAWRVVSESSGISEIHLDALAWRLGWIPREAGSLEEARSMAERFLRSYSPLDVARRLSHELISRPCS